MARCGPEIRWRTGAPVDCGPPPATVQLWCFPLDESCSASFLDALNDTERARAERLIDDRKKNQFRRARAALRHILCRYSGIAPSRVPIRYTSQGKPFLDGGRSLSFNLSHSDAYGVVAVGRSGRVGVDLERLDRTLDFMPIAARYFDSGERQLLDSCPVQRRRRAFFRLWTRKEALLKAYGSGFGVAPPAALSEMTGWTLKTLPLKRDYLCSLAVDSRIETLECLVVPKLDLLSVTPV